MNLGLVAAWQLLFRPHKSVGRLLAFTSARLRLEVTVLPIFQVMACIAMAYIVMASGWR